MKSKLAVDYFLDDGYELVEVMKEAREAINRPLDEQISPIRSWFPHFDKMTLGFHPGKICALGGRPGDGKTSFATTIIANILRFSTESVLMLSTELTPKEIILQISEAYAGGICTAPKGDRLTEREVEKLIDAQKAVEAAIVSHRLSIMYAKRLTDKMIVDAITHHCDMLNNGVQALVIIDQMNRIKREDKERHGYAIASEHLMNVLEEVASDQDVPLLVLSQLGRGREGADRPGNEHFKHTGAIEEYAHATILLNRPDKGKWDAEIIIGKNRSGKTGAIPARFYGAMHYWQEVS